MKIKWSMHTHRHTHPKTNCVLYNHAWEGWGGKKRIPRPIAISRETEAPGRASLPWSPPSKVSGVPFCPRPVLPPALCMRSRRSGQRSSVLGAAGVCGERGVPEPLSLDLYEPATGETQCSPVRSRQDVSPVRDDELLLDLAGELPAGFGTVHLCFHTPDGNVL